MADTHHLAVGVKSPASILSRLGYGRGSSVPIYVIELLDEITTLASKHRLPPDVLADIFKSYDSRLPVLDDPKLRLARFGTFVKDIDKSTTEKLSFTDNVKSLGYLNKDELEAYGAETGDWSHFLKRSAQDQQAQKQETGV